MKKKKYIIYLIVILCIWWANNKIAIFKQYQNNGLIFRDSIEGNFLAGYYAIKNNDTEKASIFFDRLSVKYPDNKKFAETSLISNLLVGNFDRAIKLAANKSNITDYIILATDAMKKKNFPKSLQILQELLQDNKTDASKLIATSLISWSYAMMGDYEQALKEVYNLREMDLETSLFHEALILDFINENELAEIAYDKLMKFNINQSFINASLIGNFYQRIGKIDKAKIIYRYFNQYNPLLQIFTNQLDQLDKETYNKKTLINAPIDGLLIFITELNNVFLQNKNNELALIYGRIIQFFDPDNPFTNLSLAQYYSATDQKVEALKYYQKIDKESFLYPNIETKIAQLWYETGRVDRAHRLFTEIAEKNKFNIESRVIYANLLSISKYYDKSIDIYSDVITLLKDSNYLWYAHYMRGSNYYLIKKTLESERDLEQALKLNPNNSTIMNDLAYSFACDEKNLDRALIMITKSLELSPDNPQYLDTMGWVLYAKKDYSLAQTYLERAIEVMSLQSQNNGIDWTLHDHLGDIYWRLGKKNLARFSWQYALEATNDNYDKQKISKKIANGL